MALLRAVLKCVRCYKRSDNRTTQVLIDTEIIDDGYDQESEFL